MVDSSLDVIEFLKLRVGLRLIDVSALVFSSEGELDLDAPLAISLVFDGSKISGQITTASDGETLIWENQPFEAIDMQEHGSSKILNYSATVLFKDLIGKKLRKVYSIFSESSSISIGVMLLFEGNREVHIINLGDDLRIFGERPEAIEDEEIDYILI